MGILSRRSATATDADGWPLAARAAAGVMLPGGRRLLEDALGVAGLDGNDRVVELEPGFGLATRILLAHDPRGWTGVDDDPAAVAHLRRAFGAVGRVVAEASGGATGLESGCASLVVIAGGLSHLDDDAAAAVLVEARRILGPSGRLVITDLTPFGNGDHRALDAVSAAGVHLRTEAQLRALLDGAGLAPVGITDGPVRVDDPAVLARAAGPRTALALARSVGDPRVRHSATRVREALVEATSALRAVAVVAERPLVLGVRRPR